jgi:hypothetical protein
LFFPSHGSLYFAADAFQGRTTAKVIGDVDTDLKAYVERRFVIGPIAEKSFNENGLQSDGINRGPCISSSSFPPILQNMVAD